MKTYEDARFGTVFEPASFGELINLAVGVKSGPNHIYMWRGQSNEEWLLHSAAYRRVSLSGKASERSVVSYEEYLLEKASHKGFRWVEGRELSDFELLARLQHHGAATRLLDATRSVLVGLYFACSGNEDAAGLLFGIHCHHLGGGEGRPLKGVYTERVKSIEIHNHPQTWEPSNVSRRVASQHSQFVYSTVKIGSHGSLAIEDKYGCLMTIRISKRKKSEYLDILNRTFDISRSTLFPDLDGFGMVHGATEERWKAERW